MALNFDPSVLSIMVIGLIIIVGVLLIKKSHKTKVSGVIPLLLFGVLLGPVLGVFDPLRYQTAIQSIITLALIIVLFDAGYGISWYELKQGVGKAILLTLLGIIISTAAVMLFGMYILHLNIALSLLLAALAVSTDLTIVAPILENLKIGKKLKLTTELESALNSVAAAVLAIVAVNLIAIEEFSAQDIISIVVHNVFVGISFGLILGYLIIIFIKQIKLEDKPYIIVIGAVLLAYAITEFVGASGIVSALIVGMVFRNSKEGLPRFIKSYSKDLELLLIIFIYVIMGTLLDFGIIKQFWLVSIVFVVIVMSTRYLAVALFDYKNQENTKFMFFASPRGIVTAVLALSYASKFGDQATKILGMVFLLVLISTLASSAIPFSITKGMKSEARNKK